MVLLAVGLAAVLIWGGFLFFSMRRLDSTAKEGIENDLGFELQAAPWSDRHVELLLARNPRSQVLLRRYVSIAVERSDWAEALRRAETFVARLPRSPQAWLSRIDVLRRAGRDEEALALLRAAVRRHSRDAEVLLAWAHEALRRRDWAESARRFGRLRRRFPAREEGYREGANALAKDGRLDEAEAVIAEGMQRTGNWLMWYTAAELAERADDREEAVRRWDAMRVRFPSVASGFLRGAEALARAGHGEAAAALIRQARDFFPGNKEIAAAADLAAPAAESPPPGP